MIKRALILTALICFINITASAQGNVVKLDLQKALEIALSDNPTIKIANMEIERQKYVRRETIGNLYPTISASTAYNRALMKSTMDFGGEKVSFEPDNTLAMNATLSLPLVVPAVYQTLKLNREQRLAAVESARASRVTLVSEVKKGYYNVMLLEQSLDVLLSSRKTITQTVEQISTKLKNDLASEYDLLTAEVQLSNLAPTILQTENGIISAKMMLCMYLGLPIDTNIEVDGRLSDVKEIIEKRNIELNTDLSENTDLRALEIQQNILDRQLSVMHTQRMPTLGASTSFQITGGDRVSLGTSTNGSGWQWQKPASVAVQLSIPIFAGFTNVYRERQLKNNITQLDARRKYTEQGIAVQVNSAINNIMAARERMIATGKTVDQAGKAHNISATRYKSGMGTILELNNAEFQLTQSQLNNSQAIFDYLSAEADYQKIMGRQK